MNSDYKVGDLIYDANIYDAMNTNLDDWYFYKRWLPENKDARILELCCGTGRLTLPIAKEGYDITGIDYTPSSRPDPVIILLRTSVVTENLRDCMYYYSFV